MSERQGVKLLQSDRPVRIAVVGTGGIGRVHLARYQEVVGAEVAAVCDANLGAAREACPPGAQSFSHVEEMMGSVQLDALDICTPPVEHAAAAISAMKRGIHVICEKPLAHSVPAAREMVAAARDCGVLLMTAFCHRFHPPISFLKRLIDGGEMGEIVMFRNRFAGPLEKVEERWFSRKAIAGGGALMDTSIHSIDLFRHLVGEVHRVQCCTRHTNPAVTEVEDTAIALLSTEDRRMGVVEACWSLPEGVQVVEVYGSRGTATVHYWDGLQSRYRTTDTGEWRTFETGSGPDRYGRELQHFVDACRGLTELSVSGEDGLRAVEVVSEAYLAAAAPASQELSGRRP